jgi:hypothetical protein
MGETGTLTSVTNHKRPFLLLRSKAVLFLLYYQSVVFTRQLTNKTAELDTLGIHNFFFSGS